eukprot:Skav221962  [mRNA]  locus=scaffold195:725636:734899:- [translate_table: standard]
MRCKWGSEKCRCIGYDGVPGSSNVTIAGEQVPYPADAGASCNAWDAKNHPDCQGDKPAAWCKKAWCYVDPCECQLEVPPKTSSYLPEGRGNGKPMYFSYAACGAEDEYTKGNAEACVNQKVESNCTKLVTCAWTGQQCLGKELVQVCSGAAPLGLLGSLGALLALIMHKPVRPRARPSSAPREEREDAERHMQLLLQQEKEEQRQADELQEKLEEEKKELEETLGNNDVSAIQVEMFEITGLVVMMFSSCS